MEYNASDIDAAAKEEANAQCRHVYINLPKTQHISTFQRENADLDEHELLHGLHPLQQHDT